MARKPNYAFEKNARAKAKAAKREAKRQAKLAAKAEQQSGEEGPESEASVDVSTAQPVDDDPVQRRD